MTKQMLECPRNENKSCKLLQKWGRFREGTFKTLEDMRECWDRSSVDDGHDLNLGIGIRSVFVGKIVWDWYLQNILNIWTIQPVVWSHWRQISYCWSKDDPAVVPTYIWHHVPRHGEHHRGHRHHQHHLQHHVHDNIHHQPCLGLSSSLPSVSCQLPVM